MDNQIENSSRLNVRSILLALLSILVIVLLTIAGANFFSWILPPAFFTAINFVTLVTCIAVVILLFFVVVVDLVQSFEKEPLLSAGSQEQNKRQLKLQLRSVLFTLASVVFAMGLIVVISLAFAWVLPQTLFAAISFVALVTFIAVVILVPLMVMKDLSQSFKKEPILSAVRMVSALVMVGLLTLVTWLGLYHGRASTVVENTIAQGSNIKMNVVLDVFNSDDTYVLVLPPYIAASQLQCGQLNPNFTEKLGISRGILDYWLGGEVYTTLVAFNGQEILDTTSVKTELICPIPRPITCSRVANTTLVFNQAQHCYRVVETFR